MNSNLSIVVLAYPGCTLLDLVGPHTALAALPGADVGIYWKECGQVPTESGAVIVTDRTFAQVPAKPTVLMVPGGTWGTMALLEDPEAIAWIKSVGESAQWVTSVCSGALLLGAAGLLEGYQATSHWSVKDELSVFGAVPTDGRVVIDRNRMTGGGVTAGIDFGLTLAATLAGEQTACAIQLGMEYAPAPPFQSGTPEQAGPELTNALLAKYEMPKVREAIRRAAAKVVCAPSEAG